MKTEYSQFVHSRTAKEIFTDNVAQQIQHAAIGMSTESVEILDTVKKSLWYAKPLDRQNLVEELGDVLFYATMLMNALDVSIEDIMQANMTKLSLRYPQTFTSICFFSNTIT